MRHPIDETDQNVNLQIKDEGGAVDSRNLAIGVLSTTAVILFVGLVLLQTRPTPAYASGMADRGGDYILITGELWDREELLYLIDAREQRLLTYKYDLNRKTIKRTAGQLLENYFSPQSKKSKKPGRGGRRRP